MVTKRLSRGKYRRNHDIVAHEGNVTTAGQSRRTGGPPLRIGRASSMRTPLLVSFIRPLRHAHPLMFAARAVI